MATSKEPTPEALDGLIRAALAGVAGVETESALAAVMAVIRPVIGAAAQRRRDERPLRDAYRDGFFMGRQRVRTFPWDVVLWKASPSYANFRRRLASDLTAPGSTARFARYNLE